MKATTVVSVLAILIIAATASMSAQTRFGFRIDVGNPPPDNYYVSLGATYDVPYRDICVMHDAGIVDEDMPPILYIYTHSPYSLRQIYSLRLNGATWDQLSSWCGVPLYRDDGRAYYYRSGPPYGNAYGYYRNGPGRWRDDVRYYRDDDEGHHGKAFKHHGHGRDDD